jgi:hypothetical protein
MGMLATGSGAAFTSAAFQDQVDPTSDLRVAVEENLVVKKGAGFDTTNSEYTDNSDFFDSGQTDDSSGGAFENDDTPLAYVNDQKNGSLVIKAAQNLGVSSFTFSEIIQVENTLNTSVDVGIAYDRNNGQYGNDVENGGLTYEQGQQVYQFEASSIGGGTPNFTKDPNSSAPLMSPDPGNNGVTTGSNNSISNNKDKPATAVEVPAGTSLQIDLVVDTQTHETDIKDEASLSGGFGTSIATVDIMDKITVGTFDL